MGRADGVCVSSFHTFDPCFHSERVVIIINIYKSTTTLYLFVYLSLVVMLTNKSEQFVNIFFMAVVSFDIDLYFDGSQEHSVV